MCASYLTWTCNCASHSQAATHDLHHTQKKYITSIYLYSCKHATMHVCYVLPSNVAVILYSFVCVYHQKDDDHSTSILSSVCVQSSSPTLQLHIQDHSNYIYRTTPLFLSTHQKILPKMTYEYLVSALLVKNVVWPHASLYCT